MPRQTIAGLTAEIADLRADLLAARAAERVSADQATHMAARLKKANASARRARAKARDTAATLATTEEAHALHVGSLQHEIGHLEEVTRRYADQVRNLTHGSTYTTPPGKASAGLAALDEAEDDLLADIARRETHPERARRLANQSGHPTVAT